MKCFQIIISPGFIENRPIIASNVEVGKLHVSFGLDDSKIFGFWIQLRRSYRLHNNDFLSHYGGPTKTLTEWKRLAICITFPEHFTQRSDGILNKTYTKCDPISFLIKQRMTTMEQVSHQGLLFGDFNRPTSFLFQCEVKRNFVGQIL